jgi:DNA (cytosine-5)-methyltransferase 1
MHRLMLVGSLFSGIGGLDLGLERAGMKIVWQVENNEYCRRILKQHWPAVNLYGDVRKIDFRETEPVDLICGGFPCQPVSYAGKRQGDKDERWLWPEFYRAVREARPRWVLVENVPGLLSAQNGRLFGGILRDLATSGYDAEWDCIPAAAFGAPHLRYRVFLVACSSGIDRKCNQPWRESERKNAIGWDGEDVPDTANPRLQERHRIFAQQEADSPITPFEWWDVEPNVGRVAYGIPHRVDRLKGLGNAVVPQVAEWIGKRIMAANSKSKARNN